MEQKFMNTNYIFEFFDGTKAELTLFFYRLYQLKEKNAHFYNRYMKIMTKGPTDEIEMIEVLYTAYLCANFEKEEIMSFEDFIYKCGFDRLAVANAIKALTREKKK